LIDRVASGTFSAVSEASPQFRTRRFSRKEYDRLTEIGVWAPGERLELLGGLLVVREPQGSRHATAVQLAVRALHRAFGRGWDVRCQLPIALDDDSEPEPDVSVVAGEPRDYVADHPARPALVVEVADTSFALDRQHKASLYARAGITDYWIVNLIERVLEVYRDPVADTLAPAGWRYHTVLLLHPPATITPLAAPAAAVPIADLLP